MDTDLPLPDVSKFQDLPKDEDDRRAFTRTYLKPRKRWPEQIADLRYQGKFGQVVEKDPLKTDWRARQANRYLTELNRRRELRPVTWGVWAGVFAVIVGLLAMPVRDSLLCHTLNRLGFTVCPPER